MVRVYKLLAMDHLITFMQTLDMGHALHECVLAGYRAIFEDMSGTNDSLYGHGGSRPDSEYFTSVSEPMVNKFSYNLVTTDMDDSDQWNGSEMDDSDQWNGSEMDDFDSDESDLVDELKIDDITHVTTPIDNDHPLVDKFHSTASYAGIISTIKDNADTDRFDPKSHVGKKTTGVYHLPVDSKLMKHPENWDFK